MHDIRFIRDHPDAFDAALGRRGLEPRAADLIALAERHRALITEVQAAQARRNEASKAIGAATAQQDDATAPARMAELRVLMHLLPAPTPERARLGDDTGCLLAPIPNPPPPDEP